MVTKSLVSFMRNLGYKLNSTPTKIDGIWWRENSVFYNEITGQRKSVNVAATMMLEASLEN